MQQQAIHVMRDFAIGAGLVLAVITAGGARAESADSSSGTKDPIFGSRTENSDGSVAVTVGRHLPAEWETKFGTDVQISAPGSHSASENLWQGAPSNKSSGALWGNMTMPGLAPYVWDKTSVEARVDSGMQQSKLGATLSRSIPIGQNFSLTLKNSYSIKHALAEPNPDESALPMMANPLPETTTTPAASWAQSQLIQLDITPSGTALSAGGGTSSTDEQWHNKLSVEQKLFGPLKVTTSVEDAGTAASKKSITAKFKHVW